MTEARVTVERIDQVALVTMRREHKKNALNEAMWAGLAEAAAELATDTPRAVVITGSGGAFCAGMDVSPENPQLAGLAQAAAERDPAPMRALLTRLRPSFDALVGLPVPVVAAINGIAFGGGAELAVRCDLRVMDRDAELCFSEVRLGLMPDMGGGVALTRLVGTAVAADLILSARRIGGDEAQRLGVVNVVSEPGQACDQALAVARRIADNGPRAVRAALQVIRRTPELSVDDALAFERDRAAELMVSGEAAYGIAALMSRSKPEFPDIA
jgi:enoyl-CoA hydratase/carnithine racemase